MPSFKNGTTCPPFAQPPMLLQEARPERPSGPPYPPFGAPPPPTFGPPPAGFVPLRTQPQQARPPAPATTQALPFAMPPDGLKAAHIPMWRETLRLCAHRGYKTVALIAELRSVMPSDPNRVVLVRELAAAAGHLVNTGTAHVHNWVARVVPMDVPPAKAPPATVRSMDAVVEPGVEELNAYVRHLEQQLGRKAMEIVRLTAELDRRR